MFFFFGPRQERASAITMGLSSNGDSLTTTKSPDHVMTEYGARCPGEKSGSKTRRTRSVLGQAMPRGSARDGVGAQVDAGLVEDDRRHDGDVVLYVVGSRMDRP